MSKDLKFRIFIGPNDIMAVKWLSGETLTNKYTLHFYPTLGESSGFSRERLTNRHTLHFDPTLGES